MAKKNGKKAESKALSPKRQRFVDEYLIDQNATQAAIRAGYSAKTATEQGSRLLTFVEVKAAVDAALAEQQKRVQIDADRVLMEYDKISRADIKDFLSFRTEKIQVGVDKDTGQPIFEYRQVVEMKPSEKVDGTMINEVSISPKGVLTFKLHDKKGALDSLARHLGLFVDKVEHTGKDGKPIEIAATLTPEQRRKRIQELTAKQKGG